MIRYGLLDTIPFVSTICTQNSNRLNKPIVAREA